MNIPANVGYHESPTHLREAKEVGFRTTQVMLGNPRTYFTHPITIPDDMTVICHGPYVTSLLALPGTVLNSRSVQYLNEITDNCLNSNIHYLVMHLGGMTPGATVRETYNSVSTILLNWLLRYQGAPITLCLENDSGSKNGRMLGTLRFVYPLVKTLDSPQIRICFDTQHAHAAGLDITKEKTLRQILSLTSVVHLNASPVYVERGSHRDLHSEVTFLDGYHPESVYESIYRMIPKTTPIILERLNMEWALRDVVTIKKWSDQNGTE